MRSRGFIELTVLLYVGAAIAAAAVIGGAYAFWSHCQSVSKELSDLKASYKVESAARAEMISGLALDLADRDNAFRAERVKAETAALAAQRDRKDRLNEFVPKPAPGSAAALCITTGFVRYYNAAAAGVPLGLRPEPGVAQAPAGVGTDTVAGVTARNADRYYDCKRQMEGALKEFDTKRQTTNSVIDRINKRLKDAERRVQ